jgi:hypothetical protein
MIISSHCYFESAELEKKSFIGEKNFLLFQNKILSAKILDFKLKKPSIRKTRLNTYPFCSFIKIFLLRISAIDAKFASGAHSLSAVKVVWRNSQQSICLFPSLYMMLHLRAQI